MTIGKSSQFIPGKCQERKGVKQRMKERKKERKKERRKQRKNERKKEKERDEISVLHRLVSLL